MDEILLLVVNGIEQNVLDVHDVERCLARFIDCEDLEIWLYRPDGSSLAALLNPRCGWLMYLRFEGDTGFSSRNRIGKRRERETEEFLLANGQADIYPSSWTFERNTIFEAILEFVGTGQRPSSVDWQDDGAA